MKQIVPSIIVAIVYVAFAPAIHASEEFTELSKLILHNEDSRMTAEDLAFFLAFNDYDATPKEGFVLVLMDSTIYSLVPNGAAPGLASLTILN